MPNDNKTMVMKSTSRELFKHVFLPWLKTSDSSCTISPKDDDFLCGKKACGDTVEFCRGKCSCHTAPGNTEHCSNVSVSGRAITSVGDLTASLEHKASHCFSAATVEHCSGCSRKLQSCKLSHVDIHTKSEPCQRFHDFPHNVSAVVNDEVSADQTLGQWSAVSDDTRHCCRESLSVESSYPDLTASELRHSRLSTKSSSAAACPHGFNLCEQPYVKRTYHVVKTCDRQDMSTYDNSPERHVSCSHPKRIPRGNLTFNDASSLSSSFKLYKKTHRDDIPQKTLSNSNDMKFVMGKVVHPKYDELEDSDWSLISSLVEDICRNKINKRKRRKKTVPPQKS